MIPFVLESYGAKGHEASALLDRMASESTDDEKSAAAFLADANRRLSVALQLGNAHVASQGTCGMHRASYRLGDDDATRASTHGAGVYRRRRNAAASTASMTAHSHAAVIGEITRADYRCARIGVRCGGGATAAITGSGLPPRPTSASMPPAVESSTVVGDDHRRPSDAAGDAAPASGAFVRPDRALHVSRPSDSSYHTVPRVRRPDAAGR